MKNPVRELTEQEKRRIRKLVTQKCANFHEEYGCLPLDCDCVMLGKVFCGNAMCRYFREFVLPNDPELNAAMQNLPAKRCKQKLTGSAEPPTGKSMPGRKHGGNRENWKNSWRRQQRMPMY